MKRLGIGLVMGVALALMAQAEPILVLDITAEAGDGEVQIDLRPDLAPQHIERIVTLAEEGQYDNIAFHRVIDGFMAQTGDVQFGQVDGDLIRAGTGGSQFPDLPAEFSDIQYEIGVVGMARSMDPDSANSQFFIMMAPNSGLNGAYTVIGQVVQGQDVIDRLKKGERAANGIITTEPDYIRKATIVYPSE